MPIRFVDRVSRIGRISATLDAMTATVLGAVTSPANRTGVIASQLAPLTASLTGFFTPAISRTGTIAATLGPLTATLTGTHTAIGLSWIGGNDTTTDVQATVGTPVDFDVAAQVTGEQSIALVSGSVPGLAYDSQTMRLTGTPTIANEAPGYDVVFDADDGQASGAAADWAARIGGPGVLWAHRFQSAENDIQGWQHSSNPASYNPDRQQFIADGGIIPGDGALRQVYAGGEDWGGGSWRWCRPMQPMVGDINEPGVAELDRQPSYYWFQNRVIGSIMHPDYQSAHGSPSRTGPSIGPEIYVQQWIKLSAGRTTSADAVTGKMVMLESAYQNTSNELVLQVGGPGARRAPHLYTNKGSAFNSALSQPQEGGFGNTSIRQPNSPYVLPSGPMAGQTAGSVCTFNNGQTHGYQNVCWTYPENKWMSVLLRFKPGHQRGSTTLNSPANDGSRDSVVQMWVATEDEIRAGQGYTLVHSKSDYVWEYDDALRFGAGADYQPYGINWFSLNHFTGGNNWAITPLTFWHQFDQIICSLQPIPCPTWAPEA